MTVSEDYDDWRLIQGVQLWGTRSSDSAGWRRSRRWPATSSSSRSPASLMRDSAHAARLRDIAVYRVSPERVSFTDNTSGLFGRETLELVRE